MIFYNKFLPGNIIGVQVFLERFKTRKLVGSLIKKSGKFQFNYDPSYLKEKNLLSLGPEFPLIQEKFISKSLFPTFKDRLPNKDSSSYSEHCTEAKIWITTEDPIILLGTVGKKGPSAFIFSPIYEQTPYEKYEGIRKKLGLSLNDFAHLCGVSPSILQKIKIGHSSGREIIGVLDHLFQIPESLELQLETTQNYLHTNMTSKIKKLINVGKKEFLDILDLEEAEGTQSCLGVISSQEWSRALCRTINKLGMTRQAKDLCFEARCAAAFCLRKLDVAYAYKTGLGNRDVDFKIKGQSEYLIECARLGVEEILKEETQIEGNFYQTYLGSPKSDSKEGALACKKNKESTKWATIQAQAKINAKVAKFPEVSDRRIHIILVNMNNFLGPAGGGDIEDYKQIAFGASEVAEPWRVVWKNEPLKGIFYNEIYKRIAERIHLIGFVNEGKIQSCEGVNFKVYDYALGKILEKTIFVANPHIFNSLEKEKELKLSLQKDFGPIKFIDSF